MKTLKLLLPFFFLLGLIAFGACRHRAVDQSKAPAANPENVNTGPAAQETPTGGSPSSGEKSYFRGTIGSGVKIEVMLIRDGERVTGNYYYPKVGKNIELNGTVDADGNLDLREKDESGKETGVFKGKWKSAAQPSELEMTNIAGKWSKPDGSKSTSFELTQQPIYFSFEAAHVTPKIIKDSNKQSHYAIDVDYPQIDGDPRFDKFNKEAHATIAKDVAAFKTSATASENDAGSDVPEETQNSTLDADYEVRLANDQLVSIEFNESEYSRGAAHPNSFANVLNYDVKNGKKLALADLFTPKSNYLKTISDFCIKDLKQQAKSDKDSGLTDDDQIQSGASPRADNYKAWTITRTGLWITFDPYQVGPYAAGPQRVLIPYSALKDVIRADGPLADLAK